MKPLFTIGHSNHSPETFLGLLHLHNITALADVRSSPYSRYVPHVNRPNLAAFLSQAEIKYVFMGTELGARPENPTCYVEGKAVYEKIAALESFHHGIQRLVKGCQDHRIALMCAEKDPIQCHRAILVCQHLVPFNLEIAHILSTGQLEFHEDLESRLLATHHLTAPAGEAQLSLFAVEESSHPDRDQLLRQAYQLQGDKIAYVEHNNDSTD